MKKTEEKSSKLLYNACLFFHFLPIAEKVDNEEESESENESENEGNRKIFVSESEDSYESEESEVDREDRPSKSLQLMHNLIFYFIIAEGKVGNEHSESEEDGIQSDGQSENEEDREDESESEQVPEIEKKNQKTKTNLVSQWRYKITHYQ